MPIEISWYDPEQTILYGKFTGDWTWEDYTNAATQVIEMTCNVEHRIDQLMDMRESGAVPQGPALTYMNRTYRLAKFRQSGITVLVGASAILHGLVSALAITNPKRPPRVFTNTIEKALKLIEADRQQKNAANSSD